MKTMSIMKTLLVTAVIMISNVTISARTAEVIWCTMPKK